MKRYVFFLLLLLIFSHSYSQDTIFTNEGDTIDCKITRITDEFIHFSVFDKSGVLLLRSRLPISEIERYVQAAETDVDNVPKTVELKEEDKIILDNFAPATLRLALNAGYTYQFGGYEGLPDSYKRQLQSLWNFGGELHYFVSENIGLGAKYNHIRTSADEVFEPPFNTLFGFTNLTDERVRFTYIAFSVMYRRFLYDDQAINYFISGGVVKYRTDGFGDGIPFYQEGDTFGVALGVNYDFILMESFGIGVGAEINIARLSEFDNNGIVVGADFSLTRADITVGIRLFK